MRINKYLARLGIGSRREIDSLIEGGKITVNNQPAELGMKIDSDQDQIKVKGQLIKPESKPSFEYWKLYKPVGVVTTTNDPEGRRTVVDYAKPLTKTRLFSVGRLDVDSEGLVLLTNDGKLAYQLTHPKFEIKKEYLVWVNGNLSSRVVRHLERGVSLSDYTTAPAEVTVIFREPRKAKFSITIAEGQNRQIRRMVARVGVHVTRLKRVKIGTLDIGQMDQGEILPLIKEEVDQLQNIFSVHKPQNNK